MTTDHVIDRFENVIARTAELILNQHVETLPNLSSIKVILPNTTLSNPLRLSFIDLASKLPKPYQGIISPWIGTLKEYIQCQQFDLNRDARESTGEISTEEVLTNEILTDEARRLLFVETLDAHPALFKHENKWQVTASLLSIFDELYLADPQILNCTEDEWINTLQSAYRSKEKLKHIQTEAILIRTLWIAWQDQLKANRLIDPVRAYVNNLTQAVSKNTDDVFYFVSTSSYTPVESTFIASLKAKRFNIEIKQGNSDHHNATASFVENAFNPDIAFYDRNQAITNTEDSLTLPFSFFPADSDESEALVIDLQVRKWLLDNKNDIGIVCENRKLARRVRALLERADVTLQDLSGWSLATTSAAAVLESWLQCIEEDFIHTALLDLIKSHFFISDEESEFHYQAIYRLEHDIIINENISSNLSRYIKQLKYRETKLEHWTSEAYSHVEHLLDTLNDISQPLLKLCRTHKKQPLSRFVNAFTQSIERLGIADTFNNDDAGSTILGRLNEMQQGLAYSDPEMTWNDFRVWLGINMEMQLFSPQTSPSPVKLLSLKQSELMRFDALVIAAADKQHFPGTPNSSPFFNQDVRISLGLPNWGAQREQRLNQFKNLLFAADEILITYKNQDKGEAVQLSPWIELLLKQSAYKDKKTLYNTDLINTLKTETGAVKSPIQNNQEDLPKYTSQSSTAIPPELIPEKFSARSHQTLISCPYMFFAGDALSLKPSEEVSDELKKSDYGQLIHRALQIFHLPTHDTIQPFTEIITDENRRSAIDHLIHVSTKLFQRELENSVLHKSWLHRWIKQIPSYIDWQMKHQESWAIVDSEKKLQIRLSDEKYLHGRIDRIDRHVKKTNDSNRENLIIDYKTGRSARQDAVDTAEDVQLISYALLDETAEKVLYLDLDDKKGVKEAASLSGEELTSLKVSSKQRLNTVINMMSDKHPLTAWGDDSTCSYCQYIGICRKPYWQNSKP